jgi:hypothetical protein
VSLFDDTIDVWSQEDIALVGGLTEIALRSRPESVRELLVGAR